jgi:hypothetical protein
VQAQKPAPPKPVEENAKPVVQEADGVKAAIPKGASEEMEEISIAGRTKMTVPKNRNQDSPKQEPAPASSEDDPEVKDELNAILKRSPSTLRPLRPISVVYESVTNTSCSTAQSLFSPNPTVLIASGQSLSSSRNII